MGGHTLVRRAALALATASAVMLPRLAHAAGGPAPPTEEPRPYATPLAIAYAIPTGLLWTAFAVSEASQRPGAVFVSYDSSLGVVLAPAIVHWSHRHVGAGFVALGMTSVLGAGGFVLGAVAVGESKCRGDDDGWPCMQTLNGGLLGESIGVTIWGVADVWALASEESTPPTPPRRAVSLLPDVRVRDAGRWTLGVAGTF